MALGLLFLVGSVVLVGFLIFVGSEIAGRVIQVLGFALAVLTPTITLVTWGCRRPAVTAPTAEQLDTEGERLAGVIARQWRQEALARSLGDPEPMPVCWELTESAVMDHSRLIAVGKLSFTGRGDQMGALAAQFRRLRRRRLVILGGPGSGKTTLAVQLLLELLATRQPGEPIPVLVSLAEWDPTDEPQLHTWLAGKLATDYPSLRAAGPTMADALAKQGHLLPILDGLDELPGPRRAGTIAALNRSLIETDQLVLTSRTEEYTASVKAGNVLTSAAVIESKPLTPIQAADYLTHCLPSDPDSSWAELLHRLRTNTAGHLATLLATPLRLWLLRTVYLTARVDPAPLLSSDTSRDAEILQADLFDQLIPAMLSARPAARDPGDAFRPRRTWDSHDVRSWLTYLARHLQHTDLQEQNLRWWHIARHTLTPRAVKLAVGLVVGSTFGLASGLTFGLTVGLPGWLGGSAFGLALGLTFGLLFGPSARRWLTDRPAYVNLQVKQRVKLLSRSLVVGLTVALVVGLTVGLTMGLVVGQAVELATGLSAGLAVGLGVGLAGGLMVGLMEWVGLPNPTHPASRPQSTYRATRTLTVLQICLALLTVALVVPLVGWLAGRLTAGLTVPLSAGLAIGLAGGLAAGLVGGLAARVRGTLVIRSGAWLTYLLATCWLAASGRLPLRLMSFLDDAYRLGLLRAVGPVYQFRHAEFQKHLVRTAGTQTQRTSQVSAARMPS